ncbi:hypothetical protein [Dyadobacter sp. NIV53]|uniref:hypothetical protein n=1 Tax=Dyadobacter sp. NIV53 TaxID=2861765 RepID=UPI001C86B7B6|nr:hypothetical protein [Dyadobacter sp. NIV53]
MIELPDDELDKLFRKSSEELDPDYEPKDWNALSKRLDREDGKTPAAWFRKWWVAGLLALLVPVGLGVYYLLSDSNSDKENAEYRTNSKITESKSVIPSGSKEAKSLEEVKNNPVESGGTGAGKTTAENEKAVESSSLETPESDKVVSKTVDAEKPENAKILPRSQSKTGGVYLEPNRSRRKVGEGAFYSYKNKSRNRNKIGIEKSLTRNSDEEEIAEARNSGFALNKSVSGKKAGEVNVSAAQNNSLTITKPDSSAEESRLLLSAGTLPHLPFSQVKPLQFPAIELSKTIETPEPPQQEKQNEPYPKMAFRFGYSPDLSTVGLKNFSKPGSAVSLMIEYALIRKLYLQVGVVRSVKVYNAKAGEYEWPSDWKPQKVYPTSVDGTCKIFEIPLNLRYDISQSDRSRWFAGAGVSSYYMGNEKYIYNYPEHTYGDVWRDYETKTGWYLLSHANASIGYEYRISKKLSLLAEPYVKIPIKKVGYGKVDLFTAGMWLSIRYTPVFK